MHIYNVLTSFIILTIVSSCQTIETKGYIFNDTLIKQIQNANTTIETVEDILGTPSVISIYSTNHWYYIQHRILKRAWFKPKIIKQKILKVSFKNRILYDTKLLINNHNDEYKIINENTKTYNVELTGIQKFIKNIGRFNKTTEGKNK